MWYVCVRDVMDVFNVCIVTRGTGCMGRMMVSPCRCCMFVSCVEDARSDHMADAYSRAGLITAL